MKRNQTIISAHIISGLLVSVLVAPSNAQMVDAWVDKFMYGIPRLRDRTMKFSSPRLEALQMDIAFETQANSFDLDCWGDNRAWLGYKNQGQVRVDAALGRQTQDNGKEPMSYSGGGAYAGYWGIEIEGMSRVQKNEWVSYNETIRDYGAGAGLGHAFGKFLIGAHHNELYISDSAPEPYGSYKNSYKYTGGGVAVDAAPFAIGITADSTMVNEMSGPKYGFQAIYSNGGLKAGVRTSLTDLKYTWINGSAHYYGTYGTKDVHISEGGGKILWVVPRLPVGLGAEYAKYSSKTTLHSETDNESGKGEIEMLGAGGIVRLFGKRLLLGAEYKITNYLGLRKVNYYTEGIEFKPLANLSLYGSYQIRKQTWNDGTEATRRISAAGMSIYLTDAFSVDSVARETRDYSPGDHTRVDFHVAAGWKF